METRILLLLWLSALLLFNAFFSATPSNDKDINEDLSFLEKDDDDTVVDHSTSNPDYPSDGGYTTDQQSYSQPEIDEKDVVVLKNKNFSNFVKKNRYVMVEFYAPWCEQCQAFAPEYAAAATELKGVAALAKVDGTVEDKVAQKYQIQGFPTIYFFIDGVPKPYLGQRTKDAIVTWVKRKTGPIIYNITTTEDAEKILNTEDKLVLAFLDSLVGPESNELFSAAKDENHVSFYQTTSPDVAKHFHVDPKVKRPALVLLKKEAEKLSHFDGKFTKSSIVKFVLANKLPLVTTFNKDNAPLIFESPIKKQLLLFATSNRLKKLIPIFHEVAKGFKGKLIIISVDTDNEEAGPVSYFFGVTGDGPHLLAYKANVGRKYIFDRELTLDHIKAFAEDFLKGYLKPFYKSDPIPETNNRDVKIVVGNNFDEIVLNESKDVLLEIYAPWCRHCEELEPIYNKLAKHLRGIDSVVIAKMDGSTNEHPSAQVDGFPTFLFYPAGDKLLDPIVFEANRTAVELYKFIKKHASIPFKLQSLSGTLKSGSADGRGSEKSSSEDLKDEL